MAPVLVATVGSATANAFADIAYADVYFDARLNASAWTGVAVAANDRIRAMIEAARELSALEALLQGYRTDSTQALCFPRRYVINTKAPITEPIGISGYPEFASNIVPTDWKDANCELALEFLKAGTSDLAALDSKIGITEKTIGPITTKYVSPYERAQGLARFPRVMNLVRQFFADSAVGGLSVVRC